MEAPCPRCRQSLDLPTSGAYQCGRCGSSFEVILGFEKPALPSPFSQGPGAVPLELAAVCAYHPENRAVLTCERCGDFICRLCTTTVDGRLYCARCFDLLFHRGALQHAQTAFKLPAISLTMGILSVVATIPFCCGILSLPLGVVGLVQGSRALTELKTRPNLPGRANALWGIGLSSGGLLFAILWAVWLAFALQGR